MYKKYYQHFLTANIGVQHYASHSHHYWPDVTREAMLQYWDDSAKYVDAKWNYFFSEKVPATQKSIADILRLSNPEQIVFAPNTHELLFRVISCFDLKKSFRVLTTDSEFHSFDRQIERLKEDSSVHVDKIATLPFKSFEIRFIEAIQKNKYELIFLSQVFFNSGLAVQSLENIVRAVQDSNTVIVVDGYHGFMALPTDLSSLEDRIFYLGGSYKYAQGGEGCCFMHVPKNSALRPLYTGWFAGFSELTQKKGENVSYPNNGLRFAGSTMDYSALYRLQAVLQLFEKEGLTVERMHGHVQQLQKNFLAHLKDLNSPILNEKVILKFDANYHGHFFSFEMASEESAKKVSEFLLQHQIKTDYRGNRLRFGFGIYQNDCIDLTVINSFS
ncbi:MAG: aminotransferase class V-fold PLP-dependent enzyme [Bdellovibrio sp.]|nr:aminotransferase class V-fold PLP-dependent enzyme [Bdellovibrio sp.]